MEMVKSARHAALTWQGGQSVACPPSSARDTQIGGHGTKSAPLPTLRYFQVVGVAPDINPTFNNDPAPSSPSPCAAAFSRYLLGANANTTARRLRGPFNHGRQSPPSHRSLRRRRRRRAGDVAGCRARGAADIGARPRRHAIRRAARQPRRPDPSAAARDRRGRARAGAAGAAAGRLSHRDASPAKRHATGRRARRDQTRLQRRRLDAAERRRRPASAYPASRSTAAAFRCRRGAAWCIASADATSASPIARSSAAAATASGSSRSPATSAATSFTEHRDHRGRVVRRAGPDRLAQHDFRHQRQRHRDPAHRDRRRRHAGRSTTASRTSRPAPAAPDNTATPSTPFAPAT